MSVTARSNKKNLDSGGASDLKSGTLSTRPWRPHSIDIKQIYLILIVIPFETYHLRSKVSKCTVILTALVK